MTEIEKIEVYKSTNNSSICKVCGKPRGNHRSSTLLCPLHPLDEYPRDYKWAPYSFYDGELPKLYYSKVNEELSKLEVHFYSQRARRNYGHR